jgi:hypothetical protein
VRSKIASSSPRQGARTHHAHRKRCERKNIKTCVYSRRADRRVAHRRQRQQ